MEYKGNLLYQHLNDDELKLLIKQTVETRKHRAAGSDLVEMKREYYRRVLEANIKRIKYMKKISKEEKYKMLDKAQKKYNSFATNKLPGGLSPMQEKFCMEFLSTGDTLMAYRAAGYKDLHSDAKTRAAANELLKKERIGARIDDLRQEAVKHMALDANEVLKKFIEVYNQGMAENDLTNANRAMEFIGKHMGMLIERKEIKQDITNKSPEELEREIKHYENVVKLENVNKNN